MVPPRKTLRLDLLGGVQVGYRASGDKLDRSKPTLVLFNPFTTTADYYLPEFENKALLDAANLVAIEPLGHGQSKLEKGETFTYWDSAAMALGTLDRLGVQEAFAAGTSQGGWIAARMALLAPERVRNLAYRIKHHLTQVCCTDQRHNLDRVFNGLRIPPEP